MSQILSQLLQTIEALRHPQNGCPWDLAQTHQSLIPYLWEETHESAMSLSKQDDHEMQEELGDLLLQILLHCQLASERGAFNFLALCESLTEKVKTRHPHVFSGERSKPVKEHEQDYHRKKIHKLKEYLQYPPLVSAQKIGQLANSYEFDWSSPKEVWNKVQEEVDEVTQQLKLKHTISTSTHAKDDKLCEELGDLYFSLNQFCRHLGVSSEHIIAQGNIKFATRFQQLLKRAEDKNTDFASLPAQEKEAWWNDVKKSEVINMIPSLTTHKALPHKLLMQRDRLYHLEDPILAITGNVSSGKSAVIEFFNTQGFFTLKLDDCIQELYTRPEILNKLLELAPHVFLSKKPSLQLNKDALREHFFTHLSFKTEWESFLLSHLPALVREKKKNDHRHSIAKRLVVLEVPLLFERHLQHQVDLILLVKTIPKLQQQWFQARHPSKTPSELLQMLEQTLSSQQHWEQSQREAHFVLENQKDLPALHKNLQLITDTYLIPFLQEHFK